MNRTTAPTRVLSVLLAFVLAATLIPSQSFTTVKTAFAAQPQEQLAQTDDQSEGNVSEEPGASSANIVSREVDLDSHAADASGAGAQTPSSDASTQNAAQPTGANSNETSDTAALPAASSANQTNMTTQLNDTGIEVISATTALDNTTTTMVVGGLTYVVNPEDATTVFLTGVADTAAKGELLIPAEIEFGSNTYKIISVENSRGGVHR